MYSTGIVNTSAFDNFQKPHLRSLVYRPMAIHLGFQIHLYHSVSRIGFADIDSMSVNAVLDTEC